MRGLLFCALLVGCRLDVRGDGAPSDAGRDGSAARSDVAIVPAADDGALDVVEAATIDAERREAADCEGTPLDTHCYFLLEEPFDWYSARDACATRSAHLVTITSTQELLVVESVGSGDRFLGLHKPPSDADVSLFAWVTGETATLDGWHEGEPNGSCAKIAADGAWYDVSCLYPLPAICEREP